MNRKLIRAHHLVGAVDAKRSKRLSLGSKEGRERSKRVPPLWPHVHKAQRDRHTRGAGAWPS